MSYYLNIRTNLCLNCSNSVWIDVYVKMIWLITCVEDNLVGRLWLRLILSMKNLHWICLVILRWECLMDECLSWFYQRVHQYTRTRLSHFVRMMLWNFWMLFFLEILMVFVTLFLASMSASLCSSSAIFDEQMRMEKQVGQLCKSAWLYLYKINKIRQYLTTDQVETIVHAFVTTKLDLNNSLLAGLPGYTG